jgi:hypothetical protein
MPRLSSLVLLFVLGTCLPAAAAAQLGLYRISAAGKAGFIDRKGRLVIHPRFDGDRYMVDEFSEGLAEFRDMKALAKYPFSKEGYIDQTGRIVIKPQFDVAYSFSSGRALVKIGDLESYIDKTGKQIVKLGPYQAGRSFREGLAAIHSNFEFWYIDPDGKVVIPKKVGLPQDFSEGLACAHLPSEGGLQDGYIDKSGAVVIPPQFESCSDFSEGLAAVKIGNKYGYIDNRGKVVIPARFRSAYSFVDGRARVSTGDKEGFIDRTGSLVIPEKFETGTCDFSEGLAPACENGRCGYIDRSGRYAIAPTFHSTSNFKDGVASVLLATMRNAYVDTNGKVIWKEIR